MSRARERREQLRIPKRELAARLGISAYELSRIESGSVSPTGVTIARMAFLLGLDATALFDLHPCECGRCDELVPRGRRFRHGHDRSKGAQSRRAWQERRRAAGVPESKTCEECGRTYSRRLRENLAKWTRRRWCSAACWRGTELCRTPPHLRRW